MQGEVKKERQNVIGPDGGEYNYSGIEELYTSIAISNTIRVYCQTCGMIVARLEARGVCYHDITILAPHWIPPHMTIPWIIDTRTALGFCLECCPTQHEIRARQELRRTPMIY